MLEKRGRSLGTISLHIPLRCSCNLAPCGQFRSCGCFGSSRRLSRSLRLPRQQERLPMVLPRLPSCQERGRNADPRPDSLPLLVSSGSSSAPPAPLFQLSSVPSHSLSNQLSLSTGGVSADQRRRERGTHKGRSVPSCCSLLDHQLKVPATNASVPSHSTTARALTSK